MFGKVIQFKKTVSEDSQGAELPIEITDQFNSEELDQGLKLAGGSRISHINFGRESYFGLVSDPSEKPANVHISLDPETKVLTRATCSCFRSSTRTYCKHVVSLVRYVLRPNPETGRLRTLGEDFQDSFWYELCWYGFRNFGDSALGFRAQVNHGGEGIRITFSDRGGHEILAFMPGERLVEEFLHEFFDIIRRDIDPTAFRRMYGHKLRDPNVPSLRRRPWQYSETEDEINRRGVKSGRQQVEESIWHRIAKVGFLVSGHPDKVFNFTFLEHKQELTVEAFSEEENVILRLVPPRPQIGTIMSLAEKKGALGSDLLINPSALETGYKIDLTNLSSLCITPVVQNPDPEFFTGGDYLDRTQLENQLYGPYYFFSDFGFFRIHVNSGGLPPEYFSPQRKTVVPPQKITAFLMECANLIRDDPTIFIDENILHRKTVEKYEKVIISHVEFNDDQIKLSINYDFGGFSLSLAEILDAKKKGSRFVVRQDKWIDATSPDFAWIEGLLAGANFEGDVISIGRSEYVRFLAFHDRLEKKFDSSKLKSRFSKLEKLNPESRLPSLTAMKGKLRPYQKNGYAWLWFLYENGFSGLLCDDMGLGKTHQVMGLMTGILQKHKDPAREIRFLVVCPTTVLSHWKDKVMEYCPHLDPYVYHGTDRLVADGFDKHRLIITSYGIALRDTEMLSDHRFELIVLDEIQSVKNKATKTYAAVKTMESKCTIGLTGTPIENSVTRSESPLRHYYSRVSSD